MNDTRDSLGNDQRTNLRIALMVYGDLNLQSGGYLYDRELVRGLREYGCTVDILSIPCPGKLRAMTHSFSLTAEPDTTSMRVSDIDPWEKLDSQYYDILLQDELCYHDLDVFNRRHQGHRCTTIAIVHNLAYRSTNKSERNRVRSEEQKYLRNIDAVITNSQHTAKTVEQLVERTIPIVVACPSLGIDPAQWTHGRHDGHDQDSISIQRSASRSQTVNFLSVGHVTPVKHFHTLVEAFSRISQLIGPIDANKNLSPPPSPSWTLKIVGDITRDRLYVQQLVQSIDRFQLESQIQFLGQLEGSELARAYKNADVMVMASREEGFGIACLEAMAFGLSVIASTSGAAPEMIRDGVDGMLFDPDCTTGPKSLTETIREYLPSSSSSIEVIKQRIQHYGSNARQRAQLYPTWKQTTGTILQFLHAQCKQNIHNTSPRTPDLFLN